MDKNLRPQAEMSLFRNFLTFKMVTVTDSNLWMLGVVWVVLVFAGLWSVKSRSMPLLVKLTWALGIICLPVIGLSLYSLACLLSADWEFLRRMGFLSPSKKKIIDSIRVSET